MSWQSMSTAPRDGTWILALWDNGRTACHFEYGNWLDEHKFIIPTPDAWHPLPTPPTADELEALNS